MSTLANKLQALDPARLRALKHLVEQRRAEARGTGLKREPRSEYPLSPPQRRLWLLSQLDDASSAYNIPAVFRLTGALDRAALLEALGVLHDRHEILRSTFHADAEGRPFQRVAETLPLDFHWLQMPPAGTRSEADVEDAVRDILLQPFELDEGPAWRARVLPVGPDTQLLVMSFHHIIFDGWSLGVLARELFGAYALACGESDRPLPEVAHQYSDYVAWRGREGVEAELAGEAAFWRDTLSGTLPLLELPADRARPALPSYRGAIHKQLLGRDLFERLVDIARAQGATPYAAFLTLFKILLHRHTGQTDLIVGTPVSGREQAELAPMLGVFVNTLPVRSTMVPESGFRTLLAQVHASSLAAFAHQQIAFDAIVEAVNPTRAQGVNPIYQVLYTYQNALPALSAGALQVGYQDVDCGTAKFDLSLDVFEGVDGPTCIFEYSADLFDADRIARLAAHFERLAEAVAADPDRPVGELEMLTAAEWQLATARGEPIDALPAQDFVDLFEQRCDQGPDTIAVRDGESSLSYRALDIQANRTARALRQAGVQVGDVVGISLPRGAGLIAAVLGCLKAGAAFVALDPAHPIERLAFVAGDAGITALLHDADGAALVERLGVPSIDALQARAEGDDTSDCRPSLASDPERVAYVVYTSGTTGQPKGVMVSHRNWVNAYLGWDRVYHLARMHAHLQMASFPFDVFCGDLIRALGSGRTLVICPHALFAAPDALYALMQAERTDCAEFVPAVFRNFAEHLATRGRRLDFMQVLVVASDSWYVGEYRRYRGLLGPAGRLVNSYGMAEASIDSTWFEGEVEDEPDGALVPIGRAFPNVAVRVCDSRLQPLPIGVTGEICVAGAGVGLGYINRPELDADKFVLDPLSGERTYRTGDLGRLRADGAIELLGRRDTQVKIRGMRIELGEIEMTLRKALASVRDCAVVVREDNPGDGRVVAYVVLEDGATLSPMKLNEHLADYLPAYMLPSAYVALDELPLSANGKVDRNRLPACGGGRAEMQRTFVSPRTLSEEILATIFVQVFNIPRVGVHDSFFVLGGHSLLAFQIVARVRELFEVDLPLQALFANPTIAGLAGAISELQGARQAYDATINALPVIEPDPAGRHLPFPLTEVQQAYWLGRNEVFEFGNVTTHSYDEMETYAIDVARFQRAWNAVVRRHDMLRAEILHDGTQRILTEVPEYPIRTLDLRHCDAAGVEAGIEGVRAEMSHQMLDVHRWPVFDVRVTLLPEGKARIHFSSDALVFDVWSFVIIIEELVKLYLDHETALPPLELSFRDYVLAEEKIRTSERYRRALGYWRERVANLAPAPQLPMAMDPTDLKKPRFTRLHAELDREAWMRLKQKAVRAGLTTTGLMLAAYAEVLAAFSRDPAFSLNLTFLNRHPMHPQVNDIVGEFTSLTLLSVDQARGRSFTERARLVQGDLWNDLEHHDISGVQVLRDLTRQHGGATRAKMPVVFTSALVVPIPKRRAEFPIIPVYRDGVTQTSQVWLDCGVWEDDQILLCNWDVVLELYPEGLIDTMFQAYWTLVTRLANEDAIWHADVLDLAPRQEAPAAAQPTGCDDTLDGLFLRSLARHPEATAVIAEGRAMSYLELAEHAAWVRTELVERGAVRGERVGVMLPKGWAQVAAVLGTMNAAAAYLPMDPALPDERLRALVHEGGVRFLITTPALAARAAGLGIEAAVAIDASCYASTELLVEGEPSAPDDLAYVIFTSGSTGRPKGVAIEHRAAANTVLDLVDRLALGDTDRSLAVSALSFDLSVFDLVGALACGGAIVMPDEARRLDPSHWAALAERHAVTIWNSVPALCGLLVDTLESAGDSLASLRHVLLSGDWIPVTLPDRARARMPAAAVTSLGGATEAAIWSIAYPIGEVPPEWTSIPYGTALRGQAVRVVDHRLEPSPTWVTGEIVIAGAGLAQGYWNDPERTAAAFVTHPRSGERLYRTGDLGRLLPDGNIEFLGREDQQVKVQGYRIELGDIEAALLQHPAVRSAVAVCQGERHGEKRLGAFFCLRPGYEVAVPELRSFLLERLPEYMVPLAMRELASLPLSANGKVDRKALPELEASAPRQVADVAPRNDGERRIAAIWQQILGLDSVGVESDFFALGGDSMMAIKLLVALRTGLQREIELREVFLRPTVASQAELIALCPPTCPQP
ncbi:MAG: amino acid adenylation domain-containing protein, partial [Rhodocyclaceae bacterium]|nr:amino acid adenylation domain-containing protein [Rhodocyclaceae bacterium]